jgi:hypothetical protein
VESEPLHHGEGRRVGLQGKGDDLGQPGRLLAEGQRACACFGGVALTPGTGQQRVPEFGFGAAEEVAACELDDSCGRAVAAQDPPAEAVREPVPEVFAEDALGLGGAARAAEGRGDPVVSPQGKQERQVGRGDWLC